MNDVDKKLLTRIYQDSRIGLLATEEVLEKCTDEKFKELIEKHSNINDTVLDCFAGSGTTGVAALELDRNFIGCEINPEYFEKSKIRIEKAQKNKEEA